MAAPLTQTLPLNPVPQPTDISAARVFRFMFQMSRPHLWAVGMMILVAVVWAVDLSVRPYILKVLLNRISEPSTTSVAEYLFWPASFYIFMSFLLSTVYRIYGYMVEIKMVPQMRKDIGNFSFERLLGQSHSYYQNNFSGSLTNKVNDLIRCIPDLIHALIDQFFSHFLALTIAIYTLWLVNIAFAMAMFGWVAFILVGSLLFSKRLTHLSDIWSEKGSTITGKIVDVLSNILSVRLFARNRDEKKTLSGDFDEAVVAEQKLQWTYFWVWFAYGYSFVVIQVINIYFLIKGRQEGWITVGDFALVLTINITIVDFLWQLTKDFSDFSKDFGRVTQALRTILIPSDMEDKSNAPPLVVTKGEISFEKVKFHYKGTDPLFQNKTVRIPAGQKVGLVGYSGSGKSTFVNIILRLFEVNEGRVIIDGQDIREVTQDSLRASIGMIPQDPLLFNRSLMENIRYGRIGASDAEVIQAAKRAFAHDFIKVLPQGYDSMVGERGVKLSGGQRQRIAIARAILKNAPILILDEATSQLDSLTEGQIQESLWQLMQGKTTLIVAHRLSTLLNMDRILVFEKGKIVQDGSHQDLLTKEGLYKNLWDAQVGGFLPENKEKVRK